MYAVRSALSSCSTRARSASRHGRDVEVRAGQLLLRLRPRDGLGGGGVLQPLVVLGDVDPVVAGGHRDPRRLHGGEGCHRPSQPLRPGPHNEPVWASTRCLARTCEMRPRGSWSAYAGRRSGPVRGRRQRDADAIATDAKEPCGWDVIVTVGRSGGSDPRPSGSVDAAPLTTQSGHVRDGATTQSARRRMDAPIAGDECVFPFNFSARAGVAAWRAFRARCVMVRVVSDIALRSGRPR